MSDNSTKRCLSNMSIPIGRSAREQKAISSTVSPMHGLNTDLAQQQCLSWVGGADCFSTRPIATTIDYGTALRSGAGHMFHGNGSCVTFSVRSHSHFLILHALRLGLNACA